MSAPFEELTTLDRLVHEPARLAILTALSACRQCDFLFLQNLIGLTKGNVSLHLTKLEDAGLVQREKTFRGAMPHTTIHLTPAGRAAITAYWKRLARLRKETSRWRMVPRARTD